MPDFDESLPRFTGKLFGNNHHYRPNSNNDSHAYYIMHTRRMLDLLKDGLVDEAIEPMGRALHYLQDGAQYKHVGKRTPIEQLAGMFLHLMVEGFAQINQGKFLSNYKPEAVTRRNFQEIFMRNIAFSQTQACSTGQSLERVTSDGLKRALDSTREYLNLTSYFFKSSA